MGGGRTKCLLDVDSLFPLDDILNGKEKKVLDDTTHGFYGTLNTIVYEAQYINEAGIWDDDCNGLMQEIVEGQLRKLPEQIRNGVDALWQGYSSKNPGLPDLKEVMNKPEKYHPFAPDNEVARMVKLLDNLSLVSFLRENPQFNPRGTEEINTATHKWLTEGNDKYKSTFSEKIETINLAEEERAHEKDEAFRQSYEGQRMEVIDKVKERNGLDDEEFKQLLDSISQQEWWQNYLNYWDNISPINKDHQIVMLKILLEQYSSIDFVSNKMQIERELENLFKLVDFLMRKQHRGL